MKRSSPRDVRFDLGEFVIEPEVAELVPLAQVKTLVLRHGRGDWGRVSPFQRKKNEAFAHPKNRATGSSAQSVHALGNVLVALVTRQEKSRRKTHLFLL